MYKKYVKFTAIPLCCVMALMAPMTTLAEQSPTMAYTAEQWEKLRDNNLEFDEITQLIHEYNPTVIQNSLSFKDFKGTTSSDIAENYYDAADKIASNMNYPDEDSSNYASGVTAYLNSQIQYENLMKQADTNTNDEQTYKLKYDQQEANLVKQAKQLMIDYWKGKYNLQTYQNNVATAEANLDSVNRKIAAGTATDATRLTSEQALTTAKTTLENAEASLKSTKEELALMCGWSYGSDAKIGELPEITAEKVAAIDLSADTEKALENNYSLKTSKRQLENSRSTSVTEQLTTTKNTAEQNIKNNVSSLYTKLQSALTEVNAANESLSVKAASLAAAERKKAAGMMTEKDYQSAALACDSAQVMVQLKQLALLSAYVNYEAAVNGLAEN